MSGDFDRDCADWGTAGRGGRAFDERRRRQQDAPDLAHLTGQELEDIGSDQAHVERERRKAAPEFVDTPVADLQPIYELGKRAFSSLWDRHKDAVELVARQWSRGDRDVQAEIMDDTALSLWRAARMNPLRRSFAGLVRTAARNAGKAYQDKAGRRRRSDLLLFEDWMRLIADDTEVDPRASAVGGRAGRALLEAMETYIAAHHDQGARMAELFRLRMLLGLSYQRLSDHLDITVSTVGTRLLSLRLWLRARQVDILRHAEQGGLNGSVTDNENGGSHE